MEKQCLIHEFNNTQEIHSLFIPTMVGDKDKACKSFE